MLSSLPNTTSPYMPHPHKLPSVWITKLDNAPAAIVVATLGVQSICRGSVIICPAIGSLTPRVQAETSSANNIAAESNFFVGFKTILLTLLLCAACESGAMFTQGEAA